MVQVADITDSLPYIWWLDKDRRNQIFSAIKSADLNPRDFDLVPGDDHATVKHRWSPSHFVIGGAPGHYTGSRVIGDRTDMPYEVYSWRSMIQRFERWLPEVRRDLEMPDLWAELRNEAEVLTATSHDSTENRPFTPDEQQEITERIENLRAELKGRPLSATQQQDIDAKLDTLIAEAGRAGRKAWLMMFVGTMFSLAASAVLPPDVVQHVLSEALQGISSFYGFPVLGR